MFSKLIDYLYQLFGSGKNNINQGNKPGNENYRNYTNQINYNSNQSSNNNQRSNVTKTSDQASHNSNKPHSTPVGAAYDIETNESVDFTPLKGKKGLFLNEKELLDFNTLTIKYQRSGKEVHLFPKVRLADLFVKKVFKPSLSAFGKIGSKRIDIVVANIDRATNNLETKMIIEFDEFNKIKKNQDFKKSLLTKLGLSFLKAKRPIVSNTIKNSDVITSFNDNEDADVVLKEYGLGKNIFTKNEIYLFFDLIRIFSGVKYHTIGKVRLLDLIDQSDEELTKKFFPKLKSKHIDFLILNQISGEIVCAIELDGNTHDTNKAFKNDNFKDIFFRTIGIPLFRVEEIKNPSHGCYFTEVKKIATILHA